MTKTAKRKPRKPAAAPVGITHRAFADLAGCTAGRITQVIKQGLVIEDRRTGKIDPELKANHEWAALSRARHENGNGVHGKRPDPLEVESRSEVELRKALAAAEKTELQNAETRRELIRAEDDRRAWARFYSVLTGELHPLFSKLAPELAAALGVTDDAGITKVQEIGDGEIFRVLDHAKAVMHEWLEEIGQESDE